jgi:hypothetical protein
MGMKILGVPILLWVVVLSGVVGVTALSVTQLTPIGLSIFQQTYTDSQFTTFVERTVPGQNNVRVNIQVDNNDVATHSANVTVACYDASDNLLEELAQLTGDVSGGSNVVFSYTFTSVTRATFSYCEIYIEDLT